MNYEPIIHGCRRRRPGNGIYAFIVYRANPLARSSPIYIGLYLARTLSARVADLTAMRSYSSVNARARRIARARKRGIGSTLFDRSRTPRDCNFAIVLISIFGSLTCIPARACEKHRVVFTQRAEVPERTVRDCNFCA